MHMKLEEAQPSILPTDIDEIVKLCEDGMRYNTNELSLVQGAENVQDEYRDGMLEKAESYKTKYMARAARIMKKTIQG